MASESISIVGIIHEVCELREGQGKKGPWKRLDIVFEIADNYGRKVSIAFWGDKADAIIDAGLVQGGKFRVWVNLEAHYYDSKWYNDIRAWRFEKVDEPVGARLIDTASTTGDGFEEFGSPDDDDIPF